MALKFNVKAGGGPPAGFYRATFSGVEETDHEEYGAGLKFIFAVADGEHRGETASRITSAEPTVRNAAGRMIGSIAGSTLQAGAEVDLQPFIGKEYLLQVAATANGNGTRIETCMPATK